MKSCGTQPWRSSQHSVLIAALESQRGILFRISMVSSVESPVSSLRQFIIFLKSCSCRESSVSPSSAWIKASDSPPLSLNFFLTIKEAVTSLR